MRFVDEHRTTVGVRPLCEALGVPRETYYRRRRPAKESVPRARRSPARALDAQERQQVLEVLHSERFADKPPAEVYGALLEDGVYHCSVRTMYRILEDNREVRERRNQLRHPQYSKPELLATAPNQVWTWDITKLLGPAKWSYFYLYVVLDIFSRYVVGWMLARSESAELARRLIRESCAKHDVRPGELTIHSDRGPSMTSKLVAQLLADLGIEKSLSRPRVSNDNPFVESHFKTLKYAPGFPERFDGGFEHALAHCRQFFPWYNDEHHHSGLAGLTPADVHFGRASSVLERRERVLRAAFERNPERFVHGPPRVKRPPHAVWINPPETDAATHVLETPTSISRTGVASSVFTHDGSVIS